jgi:hypothetical protein
MSVVESSFAGAYKKRAKQRRFLTTPCCCRGPPIAATKHLDRQECFDDRERGGGGGRRWNGRGVTLSLWHVLTRRIEGILDQYYLLDPHKSTQARQNFCGIASKNFRCKVLRFAPEERCSLHLEAEHAPAGLALGMTAEPVSRILTLTIVVAPLKWEEVPVVLFSWKDSGLALRWSQIVRHDSSTLSCLTTWRPRCARLEPFQDEENKRLRDVCCHVWQPRFRPCTPLKSDCQTWQQFTVTSDNSASAECKAWIFSRWR